LAVYGAGYRYEKEVDGDGQGLPPRWFRKRNRFRRRRRNAGDGYEGAAGASWRGLRGSPVVVNRTLSRPESVIAVELNLRGDKFIFNGNEP